MKKIPVTVLSGFLGSGKTSTINHILQTKRDQKVAIVVNDIAKVNIDGKQIGDKVLQTEEKLVEMENGCLCCTLREDLFYETQRLAAEGKCDYLIIEASGVSEPLPIAATFTFEMEYGNSLKDIAELDTMVTVVDAFNFIEQYNSTETQVEERRTRLSTHDQTSVVDLLIDQLEFANIILVNKSDLVSSEQLKKIHQMIRANNAEAKIIDTSRGNVDLKEIMNTGLFDFEKAQEYPTWIQEIERDPDHGHSHDHDHDHDHSHGHDHIHSHSQDYGLLCFTYRARKPFVPERVMEFMETPIDGLIRAKGYFWLCTRMDHAGNFQTAGRLREYELAGRWFSTIPESQWTPDMREFIEKEWVEPFGDRRQELVFIGTDIDKEEITKKLDACLISDEELKQDYSKFPDPFPRWH
ncbi:MAG: GTP-binding protein [Cyanobacteria bacterium P01_F01_bin.150]